jgi:alkylation response protein AidB-like acyl-CoA dehydrogenase
METMQSGGLLDLDWLLTDDEIKVRGQVREFVRARIKPNIKDWYEQAAFPPEITTEMGELGLLGMHLPGYGCPGRSAVEYGLACLELEAGDSGLRTLVSVQGSLARRVTESSGAPWAARDCYEVALAYAKEREQFGKPIASFQLTQQKLVNMVLEIEKGTMVALHVGRLKDAGRVRPEHISFGKLNNVRAAVEIARQARSVLGGNGITLDYSPLRHASNLESVATYEGTGDIHTLILGQHITGIAAFR